MYNNKKYVPLMINTHYTQRLAHSVHNSFSPNQRIIQSFSFQFIENINQRWSALYNAFIVVVIYEKRERDRRRRNKKQYVALLSNQCPTKIETY